MCVLASNNKIPPVGNTKAACVPPALSGLAQKLSTVDLPGGGNCVCNSRAGLGLRD